MSRTRRARSFALSALTGLAFSTVAIGCDSVTLGSGGPARFVLEVSGETFRIEVFAPAQIAAFESRLASGERGVINGPLRGGAGGFNQPWSWHLDPDSVVVTDLAAEVCDGRPSFVEDDLDYWFESVGRFCPWGAKVISRER